MLERPCRRPRIASLDRTAVEGHVADLSGDGRYAAIWVCKDTWDGAGQVVV